MEEIQTHGVNLGTVAVGTTAPPVTLYFTFTAGGSGITASVLTQGATGLDFTDAGTGSCDTNGSSHVYNPGDTCTVNVTFAPKYAGARYGAVNLPDAGGVIATAYIYGIGTGPQVAFGPGIISTVAGNGSGGYSGDGGPATSAELAFPAGVAVDGAGNLYIADYGNHRIRKVTPGGTSPPWRATEMEATAATAARPPARNLLIPTASRWMAPATSTSRTQTTTASAR